MDTLRERVAGELRATLARKRISAAELARRLGWSQSYMARRVDGRQALDLDDLERIAAALDVEPAELLRSATSITNRYEGGPHRVDVRSGRAPGTRSRFRQAVAA